MVVFEDGRPKKSGHRRFKMKTVFGTDDYASMAEALSRRAAEYEKRERRAICSAAQRDPAGRRQGQVSAVKAALEGTGLAGVPLYGMVKDDHHRTRAIVTADGREIAISMHRGVFTFISGVQDEVHRFFDRVSAGKTRRKGLCFQPYRGARRGPGDRKGAAGRVQDRGGGARGGGGGAVPRQRGGAAAGGHLRPLSSRPRLLTKRPEQRIINCKLFTEL